MVESVPLGAYLVVAAALFAIGLYGALARRHAIAILMGVELMLNAVNVNLVAFWRYLSPANMSGQVFATFIIAWPRLKLPSAWPSSSPSIAAATRSALKRSTS